MELSPSHTLPVPRAGSPRSSEGTEPVAFVVLAGLPCAVSFLHTHTHIHMLGPQGVNHFCSIHSSLHPHLLPLRCYSIVTMNSSLSTNWQAGVWHPPAPGRGWRTDSQRSSWAPRAMGPAVGVDGRSNNLPWPHTPGWEAKRLVPL